MMRQSAVTLALLSALAVLGGDIINLGNTPWRFTRVVTETSSLASGLDVRQGEHRIAEANDGKLDTRYAGRDTLLIDLLKESRGSSVELLFSGDSVSRASVVVMTSSDQRHWTTLTDGLQAQPCRANRVNDITTVNNTVGYASVVASTSLVVPTHETFRYVRVCVSQCLGEDGRNIEPFLSELEVHPVSTHHPDEYYLSPTLDDSQWAVVGLPHCFNEQDTYLNTSTGERCWRGEVWYRKVLPVPAKWRGKRLLVEFQSVNIGATVYVNGQPITGNSAVSQPGPVTHVGSSLPFVVDITPYVRYDADNLLAVKVSNSKNTFFTYPNFAENEGFGQAMGGIVAGVFLHAVDPVHIPLNAYSPLNQWGTYNATLAADEHRAVVRLATQVVNQSEQPCRVELRTRICDRRGKAVLRFKQSQWVAAGGRATFDHTDTLARPVLWYPVGMDGEPYLYTVVNEVYANGKKTHERRDAMGVRTVTWDEDYCYINGKRCILRGFGNRNIYAGLGAAVPPAMQWADVRRIAQCGGNVLRVGHQAPFCEAFDACDALGVMLIVNSGDNEWALKNEPALTYKREFDRDLMVAYRNHPSVIVWESNNGLAYDGEKYLPSYTQQEAERWDYMAPRIVMNRDGYPPEWDSSKNILIGYTNRYEKQAGHPSLNTEVYGTNWSGRPSWCIARDDYDNEKAFARFYVQNYLDDLRSKACGWIHWMLGETYGEGYTIYLNGKRNQKSLGSCAMDGNRFPKLPYRIYENALWVPFSKRPGVTLQSHWNYAGVQDVDAWSNCPAVELFVNEVSQGVVVPDTETRQCTWSGIAWTPGTVRAVGLDSLGRAVCSDQIVSAGEPHHLELSVEPQGAKVDGTPFVLRANASDALVATVRVVDKDGHWCPRANPLLHFEVEGEGVYKGSYNFYVTDGQPLSYHAPGDPELQAEGGLMRVAVRTTFTPGVITIRVTSLGLPPAQITTQSYPPQ
ncbi:MAG: DUF4982 domain-containing protein [Muribaculaceae bacterium]|nr:DUF4982 domain-containing protein [Muribaculaceae bacterium]